MLWKKVQAAQVEINFFNGLNLVQSIIEGTTLTIPDDERLLFFLLRKRYNSVDYKKVISTQNYTFCRT